jgi:hypothetical protein
VAKLSTVNGSVSRLRFAMYPLLGRGKRLFESNAASTALHLVSTLASTTGVVISTYAPAGQVPVGTFGQAEPSAKEMARRQKWARESR